MPGAEVAAEAWARITVPHIAQRPVMRRSPDGGQSFPRCSRSGFSYEVAIKEALPSRPTTVPTVDYWAAPPAGRLLVVDLDTSRVPAEGAADRAGYVAAVAEQIVALVVECGGRALVDVSPSGGRHLYVLWAAPIPHAELRRVLRALALRFAPVVDTMPMEGTDGQIRGPGSPHKSVDGRLTGFMELTCSIEEAEEICAARCGAQVWERLLVELAAELDALDGELRGSAAWEAEHPDAPPAPLDTEGQPYLRRLGGRTGIRADLEAIAASGDISASRYLSRSEARQAVLSSAAARGWRLEQVRAQLIPGGPWAAIRDWWRDEARLTAEWSKAVAYASPLQMPSGQKMGDSVRQGYTSESDTTRGAAPSSPPAQSAELSTTGLSQTTTDQDLYTVKGRNPWGVEVRPEPWSYTAYQQIRMWQQAMRIVERLLELEWGECALTRRAVLRAIGAAAQMTGSMTVEFGCRSLAFMTGLHHTTVGRVLKDLQEGPYALIDQVRDAEGVRADTYQLVVPDAVAAEASWRAWRPGRIEAIHPCFRELGLPAAFAYEVLSSAEMSVREVETAALLARSSAYQALEALAAHGLAERGAGGGWVRGPADLDRVADQTGASEQAAEHHARNVDDRKRWRKWLGIIAALADVDPDDPGPDAPSPQLADDEDQAVENRGAKASAAAAPRRADQHRHNARNGGNQDRYRRLAPPWLVAPSRRRRIGEADIGWDSEALAVLTELREQADAQNWPGRSNAPLPADVAAAVADDRAAIVADEEHLALERVWYEAAPRP